MTVAPRNKPDPDFWCEFLGYLGALLLAVGIGMLIAALQA